MDGRSFDVIISLAVDESSMRATPRAGVERESGRRPFDTEPLSSASSRYFINPSSRPPGHDREL